TGESDRDQVFQEDDEKIFNVQRSDRFSSDFVTGKRADYPADTAQNHAAKNELMTCRTNAGAAKTAHEDAGRQRDRRCSLSRKGWRSTNNSNRARSEKITTAMIDPMKASGELLSFNQPRCAAHATTAGGVKARNPAAKPRPKATAKM